MVGVCSSIVLFAISRSSASKREMHFSVNIITYAIHEVNLTNSLPDRFDALSA